MDEIVGVGVETNGKKYLKIYLRVLTFTFTKCSLIFFAVIWYRFIKLLLF